MINEDLPKRVGQRLRGWRKREGLTQQEVSNLIFEKTGKRIARSYIATIESGKRFKSLIMLESLAEGLSIPIEYFLKRKIAEIKGTKKKLNFFESFEDLIPQDKRAVSYLIKRLGE